MNDSIQFVQVLFLVGIFIIEKCIEFSLPSFGILKIWFCNKDNWNA